MRALIDLSKGGSVVAGASAYRENLFAAMRARSSSRWEVLDAAVSMGSSRTGLLGAAETGFRTLGWTQVGLPLRARALDVELVHAPAMLAPLACPCPLVMTIFDLSFLHYPDHFPRSFAALMRFLVPRAARRAAAVIAISEHTRQEIIETYGLPADHVHRTYLGVDHQRFSPQAASTDPNVLARRGIRRPYVLHVGTLNRRKNLPQLLRAFAILRDQGQVPGLQVVLVGGEERGMPGRDEVVNLVEELRLGDRVVLTGFLPAEEMATVYRNAELLAQPSLYEGFGLPVLEAMASGTPVVASNAAALPEVAGDAARLVDPTSAEALAAAIGSVLEDRELNARLVTAGLAQSARFSWANTAAETFNVYDAAVADKGSPSRAAR